MAGERVGEVELPKTESKAAREKGTTLRQARKQFKWHRTGGAGKK